MVERRWAWWAGGALLAVVAVAVFSGSTQDLRTAQPVDGPPLESHPDLPVKAEPTRVPDADGGAGRRPLSLSWNAIADTDRLADVLDAARRSANAEERFAALRVASVCLGIPKAPLGQEAASVFEEDAERRLELMNRVNAARQRLASFCGTGDSGGYLDDAHARRIAIDSPSMKLQTSSRRPSEMKMEPWGTTVLSNPQAYPIGVDVWLQSMLPRVLPTDIAGNSQQLQAVRDEVYRRFFGDSPGGTIRMLSQCAVSMQCGTESPLSQAQLAEVMATAEEIERRIRQQRWAELTPAPH